MLAREKRPFFSKNIVHEARSRLSLKRSLRCRCLCMSAWIPENYFVPGSSLMRSSLWISIYNDIDRCGLLLGFETHGAFNYSLHHRRDYIGGGSPCITCLRDEEFIDSIASIFISSISYRLLLTNMLLMSLLSFYLI